MGIKSFKKKTKKHAKTTLIQITTLTTDKVINANTTAAKTM